MWIALAAATIMLCPAPGMSDVGKDAVSFEAVWKVRGTSPGSGMGLAMVQAEDLDGDGIRDLLVGMPSAAVDGLDTAGQVMVLSGSTGKEVRVLKGTRQCMSLGTSLAVIGDVDKDGTADWIVGAPSIQPTVPTDKQAPGSVLVISGKSGKILCSLTGQPGDHLGQAVCAAGPMDHGGVPVGVIGAPFASSKNGAMCGALVWSECDKGRVIRTTYGSEGTALLGNCIANVGDVDGDGVCDVLASECQEKGEKNVVSAFSGATGARLYTVGGQLNSEERYGDAIAALGDLDCDGVSEFAVGAPRANGKHSVCGEVFVYSGRKGVLLWKCAIEEASLFGAAIGRCEDVDNDGVLDVVVGAPLTSEVPSGGGSGKVYVLSGKSGTRVAEFGGKEDGDFFGGAVAFGSGGRAPGGWRLFVSSPFERTTGGVEVGSVSAWRVIRGLVR